MSQRNDVDCIQDFTYRRDRNKKLAEVSVFLLVLAIVVSVLIQIGMHYGRQLEREERTVVCPEIH